jgi:hypothetical protein
VIPWVEDKFNPVRNGCEWKTVKMDRSWESEPYGLCYGALREDVECGFLLCIA